jgi:hypothetical protein
MAFPKSVSVENLRCVRKLCALTLFAIGLTGCTLQNPSSTKKASKPSATVCTQEYAPVCGRDPASKSMTSYANRCLMDAVQATFIANGPCVAPKMMPGGDADEHGCRASAGYVWNQEKGVCLRPWEKPQ